MDKDNLNSDTITFAEHANVNIEPNFGQINFERSNSTYTGNIGQTNNLDIISVTSSNHGKFVVHEDASIYLELQQTNPNGSNHLSIIDFGTNNHASAIIINHLNYTSINGGTITFAEHANVNIEPNLGQINNSSVIDIAPNNQVAVLGDLNYINVAGDDSYEFLSTMFGD
ncbi:MAG: hypothetical protein EOP33_02580 [Rickettsiaceae bacterium]|nr:MAG: hypothetical protein EOP33_02580 [Rickettsiaceae bacterium]